jgi:hypothetical protein
MWHDKGSRSGPVDANRGLSAEVERGLRTAGFICKSTVTREYQSHKSGHVLTH